MWKPISRWLAVGLFVVLAGCGGGGGGSGGGDSGGSSSDTTPDGFSFLAQTEAPRGTPSTSNEIVVSGIDSAASVTISGGEYSIDGGAFTAAAGSISNNQRIRVRVTASADFSATVSTVLTIGGVTASFNVTTAAPDTTPAALHFQRKTDATRGSPATSNVVTIADVEVPVSISIENGEYAIDGGVFTSEAGTISAGQSLTVRTTASTHYSKVTRARVTVGTATVDFEVTSEVPSYTPDIVVYDGQDVVHLLSDTYGLVFRWSIAEERYLDAYVVHSTGTAPTTMAYSSAHHRLYLGYSTGAIQYFDTTANDPIEAPFASTTAAVRALMAAGNYVLAHDSTGAWGTDYVFDANGASTDREEWSDYSREYAWDAPSSRVYYFRDGTSPNDLMYEVIDQTTGQIGTRGETPYHGSYNIQPPIRTSTDGRYVVLGSGDIYEQAGLSWSGSLGSQIADARWFADNSVVTLTTSSNQTTLRRLDSSKLTTLEQRTFTGQALRVMGTDAKMTVLVNDNGTLKFHSYVPNDDSDGDGVRNTEDAFPLDAAASVDTDRDGYPDAWNAGRTQSDSTTGLSLDAYAHDSACYLPAHGDGVNCNYGATIPNYVPDQVVQQGDIVYLLSKANRRVYRWSIGTERYLNPYIVGIDRGFTTLAPTLMAYSGAHQRLYLGYESGAIQYIDTSSNSSVEVPFMNTAMAVRGLAAVGNYMLAQDDSGAWATHYVIDRNGTVTANVEWNYYSREYAWDPVTSRVYFFRDDSSPNDLHYEVIDQTNGQITSEGETPYHGSYNIQPPIRVSADSQYVLLGSGDIYAQAGLTWSGSLGSQVVDARWFANNSLVTLATASSQTTLRRLSGTLTNMEQLTYAGQALRVVGIDTKMVVLVLDGGSVRFHSYVPNEDSDGDGVINTQDAFPLDPAASLDSDRDGYPDAWNAGHTQSDSTTDLSLDAYAHDSACYLLSHGDGVNCNYAATVPNYVPDQVVQQDDIIYLLSSANRRVYRWSISTETYLNPYVVGIDQGFSTLAPTRMAYSSAHQRLYLGYSTGAIQYIDVTSGSAAEVPFGNTAMAVGGLAAVGNYVLAQDGSGAWASHYIFDRNGVLTNSAEWNYQSREYAWDPVTSRVYFFRDGLSPNDLHYEVIDQTNGHISSKGETPYHGSYNIQPPIRVTADGQRILLGSGDIYAQAGLTWSGALGLQVADARWFADNSLVTLTTAASQTTLRRLGPDFASLEQLSYAGQALRVVGSDTSMVVLTISGGTVQFHPYVPNDDSDGDGVDNPLDAFPLDPAASVDTDRDGYPDAWNAGRTQSDSTTGLSLDAYAHDSACYLPSHGDGVNCNYAATVPDYVPNQVIIQGDIIYLLSSSNHRVYRWSLATATYLNPYIVGIDQGLTNLAPTKMAYSDSHERLYLGYSTGAIQYIDVGSGAGAEVPFGNTSMAVNGLAAVGNYVLAQDSSGAWATHYIFDSNGVVTDSAEWNYYSREYAWDPVSSRVYFFRDDTSPDDLHYEVIDQATGQIASAGETPYHGDYSIQPPIRVSPDGQYVLLGSGDFYERNGLSWSGSLGKTIKDARWIDNVLIDVDTTDQVEIRDATNRTVLATYPYLGQPLAVALGSTEVYLVHVMSGTTAFVRLPFYDQDADSMPRWWEQLYGLSDANDADALGDIDGDGVGNRDEYLNHSNPLAVDSDADGLDDAAEILTHHTDPANADSDGDGLNDGDEIDTYLSDPLRADSDGDTYRDFDEVLYGGDPNDASVLPRPLSSYSESFEGTPELAAWTTPPQSVAGWSIDSTLGSNGSASLKSGAIVNSQTSSARFRAFFTAGHLSFDARIDSAACCDQLSLWIDGVETRSIYTRNQWVTVSVPITLGTHDIEWRYQKDSYNSQPADAARIDNLVFAP
jgi:hypothetical protein